MTTPTPHPAAVRAARAISEYGSHGHTARELDRIRAETIDRECRTSECARVLRALLYPPQMLTSGGVPADQWEDYTRHRREATEAARKLLAELERTP
jgi:hypothetical protein